MEDKLKLPTSIQREIDEIASSRNDEVMSLVHIWRNRQIKYKFDPVVHDGKSNNQLIRGGCQCSYCKHLKLYVQKKLEHHRLKKFIDKCDMYGIEVSELDDLLKTLDEIKIKVQYEKSIKDKVKQELKL